MYNIDNKEKGARDMTYKHIIESMARIRAEEITRKLLDDNGIKTAWLKEESFSTTRDLDFGISFEMRATIIKADYMTGATIEISGYIGEYGDVEVCTIWRVTEGRYGEDKELVYAIADTPDRFDLIA